jgi:hypothetical protein
MASANLYSEYWKYISARIVMQMFKKKKSSMVSLLYFLFLQRQAVLGLKKKKHFEY